MPLKIIPSVGIEEERSMETKKRKFPLKVMISTWKDIKYVAILR